MAQRTETERDDDTPPPAARVYRADLADDFVADPENANRGTARGKGMLDRSIGDLGLARSIVVDKNGMVPAGNKTREAAIEAGMRDAIVVETDGTRLVVVKRTDWDLTDKTGPARRYALADNRVAQVDLDFDPEMLKKALDDGVDLSGLWNETELLNLLGAEALGGGGDDNEEIQPSPDPVSKLGDLWILGEHRLLCGSSILPADVARLFATLNATPWLMVTDPPYGVKYDPQWRDDSTLKRGKNVRKDLVQNDHRADWLDAYKLFPGDVAYIWHSGTASGVVYGNIEAINFEVRTQIIWKKRMVVSRGHYHPEHEPCYYAVRKGKTARWCGDRKQSTIWEMNAPGTNGAGGEDETDHSTQKPLEAHLRPILNHGAAGDVVYEPFAGSGTGVIACERARRICAAIEIEPGFVDAIVDRWQKATGGRATLASGSPTLEGKAES